MADKIAKRGISIFIDGKEVQNSVKGISSELTKLQREQKKMTIGSDEYVAHAKKIEYLRSLHREHIQNQQKISEEYGNMKKSSEGSLSKMANGFNKYFAIVTAGVAMFTGLTFAMKKFMDMRNELEDSKANLKALTGLENGDIEWLTKEAQKLSTTMTENGVRIRKSSKEIVDAFTVVGSAKPELLKNKQALKEVTEQAMILAEASKMELGDAVRGLTIAMNMYGASASEAAKYTNVLGAGAKEGAAEVSSQTESILKAGVAASQAGIPIEQLVGSIQALAEKGIKDEIAGTGMKSFFIKLQSGADDTNPKIVGLQKALENLAAQNLSSAELQKRFGLETYTVAAAMIASADKVKFYTKAVTGTNIALEQAQINSQTTAAKMAQAKNEFAEAGMKLVENLNPALLKATNLTTQFVKALANAASGGKTMTEQFDDQSSKVIKLKTNIEPLLTRYDELATKANKSTAENAELKKIVDKVALAMPGAVTAVDKYGNAIAISTTRVREFINAEVARLGVVNKKAIEENKDNLNDVVQRIARTKKKIDEINKTGTYTYDKVDKKTGDYLTFKATPEMIKEAQDSYRQLLQDKLGYEEQIKNLSGVTLKKQIQDQQTQLKAQEAAAKKAAEIEAAKQKAIEDAAKNAGNGNGSGEKPKKDKKSPFDIDLELLESMSKDDELLLKDSLARKTILEDDYENYIYESKLDFYAQKIALEKKYGKDTTDSEIALADLRIAENTRIANNLKKQADQQAKEVKKENKDTEKETKEHLERIQQIRNEFGLEVARISYKDQLQLLREKLEAEKATEEEYAQAIADFKRGVAENVANDTSEIAGKASAALNNLVEIEMMAVDNKYAKQIKAAEKAGQDTTALHAKAEEEKKQIKKKYAGIDFAITTAKIISETAAAIMKASPNVPLQIAEGVLGATQLGIATAEFGKVQNLWTGGFTGSGGKYEPKGIVHGNEFVANSDALANPNLMPVFNAIDQAQRMGTVSSLKAKDLTSALRDDSASIRRSPAGNNGSDAYIAAHLAKTDKTLDKLTSVLENGIEARSVISGRNGSFEQTKKYEKYIKNASL